MKYPFKTLHSSYVLFKQSGKYHLLKYSTISFRFHLWVPAVASTPILKNISLSSANKKISLYIQWENTLLRWTQQWKVSAIKHWVANVYHIIIKRTKARNFIIDIIKNLFNDSIRRDFVRQSLCILPEPMKYSLLSHFGATWKYFCRSCTKNWKWSTITNNKRWVFAFSAYLFGDPFNGDRCAGCPHVTLVQVWGRKNADLEYLTLFTIVYYSEMLDQY